MVAVAETRFDERFSDPSAEPTQWSDARAALTAAELYWLTTVRGDGRPHTTPLVGVVLDGVAYFCTGAEEQKARNLEGSTAVTLTTGQNRWSAGLDLVVEGHARRLTDAEGLEAIAAAYLDKYGEDWRFDVADGTFTHGDGPPAYVFAVEPSKVFAFAKDPHGQTSYRFD